MLMLRYKSVGSLATFLYAKAGKKLYMKVNFDVNEPGKCPRIMADDRSAIIHKLVMLTV